MEYLHFAPRSAEAKLKFDELIAMGQILAPGYLGTLMVSAKDYLEQTPGPNQWRRQEYSEDWIGFWVKYLSEIEATGDYKGRLVKSPNIMTNQALSDHFKNLKAQSGKAVTGVFFMATGEGGPGHRYAWDKGKSRVADAAVLFEGRKYFEQNSGRRIPFLPEAIRASLSVWYGLKVSRIPDRKSETDINEHYRQVLAETGADLNFVTESDPHFTDKLARIMPEYWSRAIITEKQVAHTSDRAQYLLPSSAEEDEILLFDAGTFAR